MKMDVNVVTNLYLALFGKMFDSYSGNFQNGCSEVATTPLEKATSMW
jgi:hypothetical protein